MHEAHHNQLSCCCLACQCLVHSLTHDIITHVLNRDIRHILIGLAGQETASPLKRQLSFCATSDQDSFSREIGAKTADEAASEDAVSTMQPENAWLEQMKSKFGGK